MQKGDVSPSAGAAGGYGAPLKGMRPSAREALEKEGEEEGREREEEKGASGLCLTSSCSAIRGISAGLTLQ